MITYEMPRKSCTIRLYRAVPLDNRMLSRSMFVRGRGTTEWYVHPPERARYAHSAIKRTPSHACDGRRHTYIVSSDAGRSHHHACVSELLLQRSDQERLARAGGAAHEHSKRCHRTARTTRLVIGYDAVDERLPSVELRRIDLHRLRSDCRLGDRCAPAGGAANQVSAVRLCAACAPIDLTRLDAAACLCVRRVHLIKRKVGVGLCLCVGIMHLLAVVLNVKLAKVVLAARRRLVLQSSARAHDTQGELL